MEELFRKIKDIPDSELNFDLRKKIKRQILILRFGNYLLILFPLLVINLLFLSARIYLRMLDDESLTVIKVFMQDFELSFDYLGGFFSGLIEIFPRMEIMFWLANLSLVAYLAQIIMYNKQELFKI
jgi:hypothetical protein